ncbi:UPF0246 protein Spro_0686, partial [Striga asiatica]
TIEKSASDTENGKSPLEISQDYVWDDVDRVKRHKRILTGSLIGKEEHMRPLAPYRLQDVVESLKNNYSIEQLDEIIKDIKEKRLDSSFYQESKIEWILKGGA